MGNLFQSLTDFRVNYTNKFERTLFHVSLERPFSIPTMKYGGRLSYTKSKVEVEDYYEGIQLGVKDGQFVTLRFDQTDVWLARSFRLQSRVSAPLNRRNLTLSGRFLRTHFSERPEDLEQDYYPLQNTAVYLGCPYLHPSAFSSDAPGVQLRPKRRCAHGLSGRVGSGARGI